MTVKVSICIPAYRQTKYLKKTLDSILCQDYIDYEVIVTDDSPDSSVEELLREYAANSKIRYYKNSQSLGSPENWNRAVSFACGEYIKIMHHDDWLATPSSLSQFVKMLDLNPEVGIAFSGEMIQSATTGRSRYHFLTASQMSLLREEPTSLFCGNLIGPPSTTIIRRSSFIGYDPKLIWLVDLAQYIEILCTTDFVATDDPLIFNTVGETHQVTNDCIENTAINLYEYFYLFEKIKNRIPLRSRSIYTAHLVELIYSHDVKSTEQIRQAGFSGEIPTEVLKALSAPPFSRKCFLIKRALLRKLKSIRNALVANVKVSNRVGHI